MVVNLHVFNNRIAIHIFLGRNFPSRKKVVVDFFFVFENYHKSTFDEFIITPLMIISFLSEYRNKCNKLLVFSLILSYLISVSQRRSLYCRIHNHRTYVSLLFYIMLYSVVCVCVCDALKNWLLLYTVVIGHTTM